MNADRIRAYRRGRNLTQQDFGDLLGVKATAVAMWEGGQEPSGAALKLLEFLIEGKHPFHGAAPAPIPWDVELTLDEFEELGRRARRAGFETTRDYIAHLTKKSLRDKPPQGAGAGAGPAAAKPATQTHTRKRGAAGKPKKAK